jgi:uncharacterized protein (TIGR03437 family)
VGYDGRLVVAGTTGSVNFPTTEGAIQSRLGGGRDAFLAVMDLMASTLIYSTLLGGAGTESLDDIVVDPAGMLHGAGTLSPAISGQPFPTTPDAIQAGPQGGDDGFLVRINLADLNLRPTISAAGVVGAGLSLPAINRLSPLGIATIFGSNLYPKDPNAVRNVSAEDIAGGRVPENLGGLCVEVAGRRAPVFFWSAAEVNFQVPDSTPQTEVSVAVVANCDQPDMVRSNTVLVQSVALTPEFFYFARRIDGGNAIAAQNALTGRSVGPPDLLPGAGLVPARRGDILTLYATGLGQLRNPLIAGELAPAANEIAASITVRFGSFTLTRPNGILYAGVVPGFAGLYQINLRVPDGIGAGEQRVELEVGGSRSPAGPYIFVQ